MEYIYEIKCMNSCDDYIFAPEKRLVTAVDASINVFVLDVILVSNSVPKRRYGSVHKNRHQNLY